MTNRDRLRGMMLGTAVGDAVGLPAEGIPYDRNRRMFKGKWRHRFLFRYGMISDDTEHTIFVAQALLCHGGDTKGFVKRLARALRWWFFTLPAGVGLATARAILKLWFGFSPQRSGVFSAGNGPAMRVAPIGALFSESEETRHALTEASTRMTHSDPKALTGAMAVADIAAWIVRDRMSERPDKDVFIALLRSSGTDDSWRQLVDQMSVACDRMVSVRGFAEMLGLQKGVTGYIYHTVPVVLYAWYRHFGDFRTTLESIWNLGGDTDTTGAIAGAVAGLTVGESGIPSEWIDGIKEWPRSVTVLRQLGDALDARKSGEYSKPVRYFRPGVVFRNPLFFITVLLHGFRRLLPPY